MKLQTDFEILKLIKNKFVLLWLLLNNLTQYLDTEGSSRNFNLGQLGIFMLLMSRLEFDEYLLLRAMNTNPRFKNWTISIEAFSHKEWKLWKHYNYKENWQLTVCGLEKPCLSDLSNKAVILLFEYTADETNILFV